MDPTFIALREKVIPKFNRTIADGVAMAQMKNALSYIDQVWKSVSREFPEGLVYLGFERCLPTEEYKEGARKILLSRNSRRLDTKLKKTPKLYFDLARSDVYLVKYFFRYKGEDLTPKYLYMPFVSRGGLIYIAGSRFAVSPILHDIIISPDDTSVFARLLCTKFTFKRLDYTYNQDNKNKVVRVVWSSIYYMKEQENDKTVSMVTCLAHYLFCRFGVRGTFDKYLGVDHVLGTDDINVSNYPIDDWVICESRGIKPSRNVSLDYVKPKIKIAIRRNQVDQHVESLVGALFYLLDHFPKRLVLKDIDNVWLWKVLMGHILWSGNYNEGLLHDKICDHFKSIDQYLDSISQKKLADIDIHVNDTYDFFMHVIRNVNNWILRDHDKTSTMYGKELMVLNDLLYLITHSIVATNFALQTASRRFINDPNRPLSIKTIEETFKKNLKPGPVFKITSECSGVSSFSVPGDNMAFKLTSLLVPQNSAIKGKDASKRAGRRDAGSQSSNKLLDASIAEIGGFMNVQKKAPSGRTRLNVYASITSDYVTKPSDKFKDLIERTQDKIKRR